MSPKQGTLDEFEKGYDLVRQTVHVLPAIAVLRLRGPIAVLPVFSPVIAEYRFQSLGLSKPGR
jgi:hypothetical protein